MNIPLQNIASETIVVSTINFWLSFRIESGLGFNWGARGYPAIGAFSPSVGDVDFHSGLCRRLSAQGSLSNPLKLILYYYQFKFKLLKEMVKREFGDRVKNENGKFHVFL